MSKVFPDPLDPAIIKHCPPKISKLTSSSAVKRSSCSEGAGKVFVMFVMEKREWGSGFGVRGSRVSIGTGDWGLGTGVFVSNLVVLLS
jgi:hypothetical protein